MCLFADLMIRGQRNVRTDVDCPRRNLKSLQGFPGVKIKGNYVEKSEPGSQKY